MVSLKYKLVINGISFQALWFTCVLGNNLNALIALLFFITLHQTLYQPNMKTWLQIIAFSVIGYLGDSLIAQLVEFQYASQQGVVAPFWLFTLWLGFITCLKHSLKWLFNSQCYLLAVALLGVPASYIAGIQLSSTQLEQDILTIWPLLISEAFWWCGLLFAYEKYHSQSEVSHA